ncbi:MAG TPA: helix-turn-helix domain-containing protein [Micromonosporaceae bacterium]|nr:helix-turn-helix domain-containing protein [Micromonosporaceae bacterium]
MSLEVGPDPQAGQDPQTGRDPQVEELRALAHPIRLRILSLLTGAAMTAAEVARELGLTHANASYHLRQLYAAGTIRVAGEERIRGGAAKRYRYDTDHTLSTAPPGTAGRHRRDKRAIFLAYATELRRRLAHLRDTPGRTHGTDAELWVDPEVWTEFHARVNEASRALHRAAQPPRTPGTIRTNSTIALFEMDPE